MHGRLLTVLHACALGESRTDTQADSAGRDLYKSIVALLFGKPPLTRDFGPVGVLGRYSHLCQQGERLQALLEIVPQRSSEVIPRTQKRVMPHLDADQITELVAGYASGVRVAELVKRFDVDQTTVQRYVRRAGLPRRQNPLDTATATKIIRFYSDGMSVDSTAAKLGVSPTSVRPILTRGGIQLRGRGRPMTR